VGNFSFSKEVSELSSEKIRSYSAISLYYMDPKCLAAGKNEAFDFNKKSDVYSVGVLLWQISSGYHPFEHEKNSVNSILDGKREKIIDGTPIEYSNLYTGKYH